MGRATQARLFDSVWSQRGRRASFACMWIRSIPAIILIVAAAPAGADGITLSGTAEMGLAGVSDAAGDTRTRLLMDLDARVYVSTTTDNGLTFALEFDLEDLDDDDDARQPLAHGPGR